MYSIRRFSALTDKVYYQDVRKRYERSDNVMSSIIGGMLGAGIGITTKSFPVIIGLTALGGLAGYKLSKWNNQEMQRLEKQAIDAYNKLSDEDKKFMAERLSRELSDIQRRKDMMEAAEYNARLNRMYK